MLWNTGIRKQGKMRIYNSMVNIKQGIRSETWRLKDLLKNEIEATEMDVLRRANSTSKWTDFY